MYILNAGAGVVANGGIIGINEIPWCLPSIDPRIDSRILVLKKISVIMNEKPFISMYRMLITSQLVLVCKCEWKELNI